MNLSDKPLVSWSARAIYKPSTDYPIDLLPDRQGMDGGTDDQRHDLQNWLNLRALPELKRLVKEQNISTDSQEVVVIREFKYELKASPNGSYGYLYITAGELPVTEIGRRENPCAGNHKDEAILLCGGIKYVWGATNPVPAVGDEGQININRLGDATVVGYQDEKYHDDLHLLNLRVKLAKAPNWWKEQNYWDYVVKSKAKHVKPVNKTTWLKTALCIIWGEWFEITKSQHLALQ
jgi:hypothetical protein